MVAEQASLQPEVLEHCKSMCRVQRFLSRQVSVIDVQLTNVDDPGSDYQHAIDTS